MKRFFTTASLLALSLILVAQPALAVAQPAPQNSFGQALEIAPPVLNYTADPGEIINAQVSIRCVSTSTLIVTSEINDFTADTKSEGGIPNINTDTSNPSPNSLIPWVAPLPKMTLKPRQIENLPVKISIPRDTAPGGYYGAIRFTVAAPDMKDSGVSLAASLSALIMIRVKGEAKESMQMQEFYVSKDDKRGWFFDAIPVTFTERIKNDGNVFEQPRGNIIIKDLFGNITANVNFNLENRYVLPNSVRKFDQPFDSAALGNRFMFGPYSAELTMKYGNDRTVTSKASFWIFPWKLILAALILLIVLVLVVRMMFQRYTDRVVGKSRGSRRR